jgi:hypothetical protein
MSSAKKTVLLGMNCDCVGREFYPVNAASSGGRLMSMLNLVGEVSKEQFLDGFERVNVHYGVHWSRELAQANRVSVIEKLSGKRVIVLGRQVTSVLRLPRSDGFWTDADGYFDYTTLPHPSGLTRDYNDPEFRLAAGKLLYSELSLK